MTKKTFGVILAGAGYLDGSEIQEAVLVLLALDEADVAVRVFAPDAKLAEVDHLTRKATGVERSVLNESARIARGHVEDLAKIKGTDLDGWLVPGGSGAAKNLSDFATKGTSATVHKEVARVLRDALAAQIPVGACCMAPVVVAAATKGSGRRLKLTIGNDPDTAKAITSMGHVHIDAGVTDVVIDADHHVVTTPAYMFNARLSDVAVGIRKMVSQVIAWAE
jgi:enhancing lycopene biosynthesis protein 2